MEAGGPKRGKKNHQRDPQRTDLERNNEKRKRQRADHHRSQCSTATRRCSTERNGKRRSCKAGEHETAAAAGQDQAGQQEEQGRRDGGGGGGGGGGDGGDGECGGGIRRNKEPPQKEIRILYTNAQSLTSKASELEVVSTDLKPDLILLCETWCNSTTNSANLEINGYNMHQDLRKDRTNTANGIGGGLLVYTRPGLDILPCDLNSDFNQYCKFSLASESEQVFIYLLYRPPSAGQKSKDDLCELVRAAEKNSLFIGDFNLPGIDWSNGSAAGGDINFVNTLQDNLFSQMVDFPTHIKGNCLDLIVTNMPEKIDNICEVGRLGRSDHCKLQFDLRIDSKFESSRRRMANWKRANWDRIRIGLEETVWPTTGDPATAEETWQLLRKRIEELNKENVPECDFKPRKSTG